MTSSSVVATERLLAGRYRLEAILGHGGMSHVYRGFDLVLDRPVALKMFSPGLAADVASIERFRREARAIASLNHPGIVSVFDTGVDGGRHYIVMEYVEGRTLQHRLEAGPLAPSTAMKITRETAIALSIAHRRGIVHGDVKPGNIMITDSGVVKVMDFGIARAIRAKGAASDTATMGTPGYLSPEQVRGEPVDARSDVYSLGVVLYEMLTGLLPFKALPQSVVPESGMAAEPPSPSQVNRAVGQDADGVVMRALSWDPAARHQSMSELCKELARVCGPGPGETDRAAWARRAVESYRPSLSPAAPPTHDLSRTATVELRRPSRGRRDWGAHASRRAWRWALLLGFLGVLLAGGLALWLVFAHTPPHAATPPGPARTASPTAGPSPARITPQPREGAQGAPQSTGKRHRPRHDKHRKPHGERG